MTDEEKAQFAAGILYRCLLSRYAGGPSPFDDENRAEPPTDNEEDWTRSLTLAGDLAIGLGGEFFNYYYLPIEFVEKIIDESLKIAVEPVTVEISGKKHTADFEKVENDNAHSRAETYAIAATVYLLNNHREKLNEAIEELFVEAVEMVRGIHSSTIRSIVKDPDAKVTSDKNLQTEVVDRIIKKTTPTRKERLRKSLWEINPSERLTNLSEHYSKLKAVWDAATDVYKKSKTLKTWKQIVIQEIKLNHDIDLPEDLVSLLSKNPADHSSELKKTLRLGFEQTASGLAWEHAARLCGVKAWDYVTGSLREIASREEPKLHLVKKD
ncbi:MAG: hypothetical protein WBP93_04550 [Pyrinomonadaceae bacterium]